MMIEHNTGVVYKYIINTNNLELKVEFNFQNLQNLQFNIANQKE